MDDRQSLIDEAVICTVLTYTAAYLCHKEENEKRKPKQRTWVREFLKTRQFYGAHVVTVNALQENDPYSFRRYLRMNCDVFEVITLLFHISDL